jgi:hypothetical protein
MQSRPNARVPGAVLLRTDEAAHRLQLTTRTLELWRRRGVGPRYIRLNARTIRYRVEDLNGWLARLALQPAALRDDAKAAVP